MDCRHEVWARVLWAKLDAAERAGLDLPPLFEGLPFDARSVRRLGRIAWEHLCEVVERIASQLATPEAFDAFVESTYHHVLPDFKAIAQELGTPKEFVRVLTEEVHAIVVPPIEFRYEDLGGDRARVLQQLYPGARPCLPYFRWKAAGYRNLPAHFGLPPADVRAELSSTGLELDITFPPSPAAAAGVLSRGYLILLGYSSDGQAVYTTIGSDAGDPLQDLRMAELTPAHKLTAPQAKVLALLVTGVTNKEIARSIGCADNTVEAHITQLLRKFRVESRMHLIARFWSDDLVRES